MPISADTTNMPKTDPGPVFGTSLLDCSLPVLDDVSLVLGDEPDGVEDALWSDVLPESGLLGVVVEFCVVDPELSLGVDGCWDWSDSASLGCSVADSDVVDSLLSDINELYTHLPPKNNATKIPANNKSVIIIDITAIGRFGVSGAFKLSV